LPTRRDAEKAVVSLRININAEISAPQRVCDLITHFLSAIGQWSCWLGTGLRRSEMIALTWTDVNTLTLEVNVLRSCVRDRFGDTKTECSRRPVPLHPLVLSAL